MEPWIFIPLVAIAGWCTIWLFVAWLLSTFSGWKKLAAQHPDREMSGGSKLAPVSGAIGGVRFNNSLSLAFDARGVRVSMWIPMFGQFPPFAIGWNEITSMKVEPGVLRRRLELHTRERKVISLYGRAIERVMAASERQDIGSDVEHTGRGSLSTILLIVVLAGIAVVASVAVLALVSARADSTAAGAAPKPPSDARAGARPLSANEGWKGHPHGVGAYAVDDAGERVAMAIGGGWDTPKIALNTWRNGDWLPVEVRAAIPVVRLDFERDELVVNLGLRSSSEASTMGSSPGYASAYPPGVRCGKLVVVAGRLDPIATVLRKIDAGWAHDGALKIDAPTPIYPQHSAFACDGERIVAFIAPIDAPCAVLEFEQRDGRWVHGTPWFPGTCPEGRMSVGGVAVALHRDLLLVGAYPATGDDPGMAALYARDDGKWVQQGRFVPEADSDPEVTKTRGTRSFFGGRVALDANYLVISAGRKRILESAPGVESSTGGYDTVYLFARKGTAWESEETLEHADAAAGFGDSVAIRGKRVFVSAPVETAVYALERLDGRWQQFGRIPGEEQAQQDADAAAAPESD